MSKPDDCYSDLMKVLNKYTTYIGGGQFVTTTTNGDVFALACTRPTREFYKKQTTYVIELRMDKNLKKVIEENFTKVKEDVYVTSTKEKNNCFALNTAPRGRPLHKKQDNYVIEMEKVKELKEKEDNRKIKIEGNLSNTNHHGKNVYSTEGLSPTLCAGSVVKNGLNIKTNTQKGYEEAYPHDGVRLDHPNGKTGRGRVQSEKTGTLTTSSNWGTVDADFRIRKLTPVECERLQAFPDNWTKYGKDGELISNTQRYKCCGNAVTTTVVTYVINEMFKKLKQKREDEPNEQK